MVSKKTFNYYGAKVSVGRAKTNLQDEILVFQENKLLFSCSWDFVRIFPLQQRVIVITESLGGYYEFFYEPGSSTLWSFDGECRIELQSPSKKSLFENKKISDAYVRTLLSGRVTRIACSVGARVSKGVPLAYIEAMKMENEIISDRDGIIKTILIKPGNVVKPNEPLILFERKGE